MPYIRQDTLNKILEDGGRLTEENEQLRALANMSKARGDLEFLKEIQERLSIGIERGDPTQVEYAREMIRDWIEELETAVSEEAS